MTETEKILYQQLGTDWWLQINEQPYFGHVIKAIEEARRIGQKLPIGDVSALEYQHTEVRSKSTDKIKYRASYGSDWAKHLMKQVDDLGEKPDYYYTHVFYRYV